MLRMLLVKVKKKVRNMLLESGKRRSLLYSGRKLSKIVSSSYVEFLRDEPSYITKEISKPC